MVTKRNRAQVGFEPNTPAVETFRAQNVPFIPAQRRTGVGSGLQQMGSALERLGAALGAHVSTKKKSQAEYDAERLRHEKYIHTASKYTPEQRAAFRAENGIAPITDEVNKLSKNRQNIEGWSEAEANKIEGFAAMGWKTPGEFNGEDVEGGGQPITNEWIEKYFHEKRMSVYEAYGDGRGEKGRVHNPQVKDWERHIDRLETYAKGKLKAYAAREVYDSSIESVRYHADRALIDLHQGKNFRGQQLLDQWQASLKKTFETAYGRPVDQPATRNKITEEALKGLLKTMRSQGEAEMVMSMMDGRLGQSGPKLREAYPHIIPQLLKKAQNIYYQTEVNEVQQKVIEDDFKRVGNGEYYFGDYATPSRTKPGEKITLTNKVRTDLVKKYILDKAGVRKALPNQDPTDQFIDTIIAYSGTPYTDDEIKSVFGSAGFGLAGSDPEKLKSVLSLYRTLRAADPTKVDQYISDPQNRAFIRTVDALLERSPALGYEGALRIVQGGLDETGKIADWTAPQHKTAFNTWVKTNAIKLNLDDDDLRDISLTMRLRLKDPAERNRIDSSGDGTISVSEFKAALANEYEYIKTTRGVFNKGLVKGPANVPVESYIPRLDFVAKKIASTTGVPEGDIRAVNLPQNLGIRFTDKNGRTLTTKGPNGEPVKLVYSHNQIINYTDKTTDIGNQKKILDKQGVAWIRRSVKDQQAEIDKAKLEAAEDPFRPMRGRPKGEEPKKPEGPLLRPGSLLDRLFGQGPDFFKAGKPEAPKPEAPEKIVPPKPVPAKRPAASAESLKPTVVSTHTRKGGEVVVPFDKKEGFGTWRLDVGEAVKKAHEAGEKSITIRMPKGLTDAQHGDDYVKESLEEVVQYWKNKRGIDVKFVRDK